MKHPSFFAYTRLYTGDESVWLRMQPRRRTQRDSNPQPPVASTPLSTRALCHLRAICPVILFWATSWANHPRGGQTPFTDRGGQWFRGRTNPDCQTSTSGASWDGRSDLWPRFLWPASRAGRYRDGQESLAALYVCRHTHSLPAHGVAHRSGFQPRVSPPFRRSCGKRKRANPLSNHAFVRSMVRI